MPVFREKSNKLNFKLSNNSDIVKIKVDCYFGTRAAVSFFHESVKSLSCGETKEIGDSNSLKGKSVTFNGAANNPDEGQVKITHTIWQENGNSIEYTIPDDYTGDPLWDPDFKNPSYQFQVNFI